MKRALSRLLLIAILCVATGAAIIPAQAQGAVSITPDAGEKSGAPGGSVTFNLAITAPADGTYTVTTSNAAGWTVNVTPTPVDLKAGVPASASVEVDIPPAATGGETVPVSVSVSNGTYSGSATLQVRVVVSSAARPLITIESYYLDQDTIRPGESFRLYLSVRNSGGLDAHNLIFTFTGEEFQPQETGGVVALGSLGRDQSTDISQKLQANNSLWGKTSGTVTVSLTYNSPSGESFSEAFTVTLAVLGWSGAWTTATPTPTATGLPRAQLVVSSYATDVDPLQPGTIFNMELEVRNLGSGDARAVTMVLGGGAINTPSGDGTQVPGGGVSGSGADLSVFAPLGTSNLTYMGDVAAGQAMNASQKLIVNVSANPGAYALKLSFAYTDAKGNRQIDDQVVTLLVYQLPQIEVNFYRDPGVMMTMQMNTLPIQVVNLGRKAAVMGNMTVTAENAELVNNVSLVGTLEAGGYFPLDVMYTPQVAGSAEIKVTINYTDDFNQFRTIEKTIPVEVIEGMVIDPGITPGVDPGMEGSGGGGSQGFPVETPTGTETFWQKALRFLKGLVGLDSAPVQNENALPGEVPLEGMPGGVPLEVPAVPSGKG